MQDVGGEAKTVLTDNKDTALWANWQTTREKDTDVKIGLGMNTDGMYIYIYTHAGVFIWLFGFIAIQKIVKAGNMWDI